MTKVIFRKGPGNYLLSQFGSTFLKKMYELVKLINFACKKADEGRQLALATIIETKGSSYRKKGTQMIVADDLVYEGALSGGCVEKDVLSHCQKVFSAGKNIIFEYDGRYKLGCNGKIYILIEYLENDVLHKVVEKVNEYHQARKHFRLGINKDHRLTTSSLYFLFGNDRIWISHPGSFHYDASEELEIPPQNQLVIIGGEFDSVILARFADQAGFQTALVVKESFSHHLPKTVKVIYSKPETLAHSLTFDDQTAVVLMTHSLSRDLSFLIEMLKVRSKYLGILGPPARKETILNDLIDYNENIFLLYQEKLSDLRGPIGLNIGARTPEEISISILSEIIATFNGSAHEKQEVRSHIIST